MAKRCKHKKGNQRCRSYALTDDDYCFCHSPKKAKERAKARRKGGKKALAEKKRLLEKSDIQIKNTSDVVSLLNETINQVRTGEIEVKIANAVGYLSGICLKALEQGDMEKRLEALEEKVFDEPEGS